MKKILLTLILIPFFCFTQNNDCGEKPVKPIKLENQTQKEYKKSITYIQYKENLKIWKRCVSPLGMSERDAEKFKKGKEKRKIEASIEKFKEKISNPCGDKPPKPVKQKGQKHDDYIKTPPYLEYKKGLKEWKKCVNPQGISKRNEKTMNKDFNKILDEISKACGDKPKKPKREKGLNHAEYKQTSIYIKYRKDLKNWNDCSSLTKKRVAWGDCGDKPTKPFREEGLNHEEYKQKPSYIEYKMELDTWQQCIRKKKQ